MAGECWLAESRCNVGWCQLVQEPALASEAGLDCMPARRWSLQSNGVGTLGTLGPYPQVQRAGLVVSSMLVNAGKLA
jgi:hypothetical protein